MTDEQRSRVERCKAAVSQIMNAIEDGDGNERQQITMAIGTHQIWEEIDKLFEGSKQRKPVAYLRVAGSSIYDITCALNNEHVLSMRFQGQESNRRSGESAGTVVCYAYVQLKKPRDLATLIGYLEDADLTVRDANYFAN